MSAIHTPRNLEIWELRKTGMTLAAIGERYGVQRERIRQIVWRLEREARRDAERAARDK